MVEYGKVNVELSDTQLKNLKPTVTNKTSSTLGMSLKMFAENDKPRKFLLTTRQKTKLTNAFNKNTSTDVKLSKAQISNF